MIPWFFKQQTIRDFPNLSTKKQNKRKTEIAQRLSVQKQILESRISFAKESARKTDQLLKRKRYSKAREEMGKFKLEIVSSQPVLNTYVATSLEKQMHDVMSIEGFEFPDLLLELRNDIDFGLFAINVVDDLDIILQAEIDPFSELGIDLEAED